MNINPNTVMTCWAATMAMLSASPVVAQDAGGDGRRDRWTISAGPGVVVAPRYPGAKAIRVLPIPAIDVAYEDRLFLNGRDGVGVWLIGGRRTSTQVSLSVFARFDRRERDDPVRLRGLGGIDAAPSARLNVRQNLGPLAAGVKLARDFGGSDGTTLDLSVAAPFGPSKGLFVSIGPTVSLADERFNRAFFGVSSRQAARGARNPYSVGGGIYQVGAAASLVWTVDRRWTATLAGSVNALTGAAADSPIVARKVQPAGALAIGYRF